MAEDEFMGWLVDILHEAATERHPDVIRVEYQSVSLTPPNTTVLP